MLASFTGGHQSERLLRGTFHLAISLPMVFPFLFVSPWCRCPSLGRISISSPFFLFVVVVYIRLYSSIYRVTLDPTRAPFGFHLTRYCYYLRTEQRFPDLSVLGFDSSFLSCVLNQVLEVLSPSVNVIYALGLMDNSSESIESVMTLDENFVRADSPNSAQPSVHVRSGHFAGVPYAIEHVLSTLSRSRLEVLHRIYQIP